MGDRFRVVRGVGIGVKGLGSRGGRGEVGPGPIGGSGTRRLGARHLPNRFQIGRRSALIRGVKGFWSSRSLRGCLGAVHSMLSLISSAVLAAGVLVVLLVGGESRM